MTNSTTGSQEIPDNGDPKNNAEEGNNGEIRHDNTIEAEDEINETIVLDNDYFGDKLSDKPEGLMRLGFINIHGLPPTKDHPKNRNIYDTIENCELDITGMAEVNKCWFKLPHRDSWKARTLGWWQTSKTNIAYNTRDISSVAFQPGGVLQHTKDKLTHRIIDSGIDNTKLGRWTWQRFRGRANNTVTIITAYRPCKSTGMLSTYQQQKRFFTSIRNSTCPRLLFLLDLGTFILHRQQEGDKIILMMDCNTHIYEENLLSWLRNYGLISSMEKYDNETLPPTYNRGTAPIDGIFCSQQINITHSGYLPFGEFPSDHRTIWIDVEINNLFGYNMPKIHHHKARRLRSDNPKIRNRFNSLYKNFIRKHRLHKRIFALEKEVNSTISKHQAAEFETLLKLRYDGIRYANKNCRKFYTGAVPFSAEVGKARKTIELWKAVITKKQGCRYSMNKLRSLEK